MTANASEKPGTSPAGNAPAVRVLAVLSGLAPAGTRSIGYQRACEQKALDTALALCVRLKCPLTALTVGATTDHVQRLESALARGCRRAIALTWPGAGDGEHDAASSLDYLAIAEVLRAAIVHLSSNVVICADDSRAGAPDTIMGPAVAELMGAAHLTGVIDIRPRTQNGVLGLWVEQRADEGAKHRFYSDVPVVLSVDGRGPATDRRPAAAARDAGGDQPKIEFLATTDLGIDSELLERGQSAAGPAPDRAIVADSPGQLLTRLFEDHLLA